ncbi:MAG: hypothetical protein ACR2NB_13235 [Solirubrobacteraceae bacterium]
MALALAAAGVCPAAAPAQTAGSGRQAPRLTPISPFATAPGRVRTMGIVVATARRVGKVDAVLRRRPGAYAQAYLRDRGRWQVSWFAPRPGPDAEIAQVTLSDRTGRVLEAWTGVQVAWTMARGYPGAFGATATALYVWLGLLGLFALPFLRRPWRMLHLDLAVLASLSVSLAFFSHGRIGASVPLAYPPLLYLLGRLLWLAGRRGAGTGRQPLVLRIGPTSLLAGIAFLLAVRLGLQLVASNVIDVGYAGVIGADRLGHGSVLYGHFPLDNPRGDTYGPLNYLAYLPFELLWPWHGGWDDLPSAHAATAAFDLVCVALLFVVGRRSRSSTHGLLLAYLWLAFPFTLLAANSGANDPLVGALVLGAVGLAGRPAMRGAVVAGAALTKLAPFGLLPLLAGSRRAGLAATAVLAALLGLVAILDGGLGGLWSRTVAFQAGRDSPFSIWGLYDLRVEQHLVQVAAVALAVGVAFVPRRRDPVALAALAAAVLIAVQLGVSHWFYLYLVWFLPAAFVALLGRYEVSAGRSTGSIESAPPAAEQRISTALIHGSSSAAP